MMKSHDEVDDFYPPEKLKQFIMSALRRFQKWTEKGEKFRRRTQVLRCAAALLSERAINARRPVGRFMATFSLAKMS